MSFDKIVVTVLAGMGGEAHSEDSLFSEILKQYPELIQNQSDIRNTISALIQKGVIIHDKKMPNWIKLNGNHKMDNVL